jgi:O-antigen ligase
MHLTNGGITAPVDGDSRSDITAPRNPWLGLLLTIGWAYGVIPSALAITQTGRSRIDVSITSGPVGAAALVGQALWLSFLLVAAVAIFRHARARPATSLGSLLIFLAPWMVVQLAAFIARESVDKSALMYPLAAMGVWLMSPSLKQLKPVAILTALTCASSIFLGLMLPDLGNVAPPATGDKASLSGLLAGVYSHPNTLGMAIALGFPMVVLLDRQRNRILIGGLLLFAAGMAASRTTMFALVIELILLLALRRGSRTKVRFLVVVLAALGAVIVYLPLSATDSSSYSERGGIWVASLAFWQQSPWWGLGPNFYRSIAGTENDFGYLAFHGHNLFVHFLTTTGIVGTCVVIIFLGYQSRTAITYAKAGNPLPGAFIAGFLALSWLELATDFRGLSTLGFAIWLPMAVFAFSRDKLPTLSASHEAEATPQYAGHNADSPPRPSGGRAFLLGYHGSN